MTLTRAHVYISGRVQGVFYRSNTKGQAHILGVSGFVKNLPDGRVEAVFEGEEVLVNQIISWCRNNPGLSWVQDMQVEWEKPTGEYIIFEIRY